MSGYRARHPVEPGDEVARHLVAVGFVQRLVPRARVDAGREPGETRALQRADEALDIGPHRIALAGKDVDRHILADARKALRREDARQRVEDVDGELSGEGEAAV